MLDLLIADEFVCCVPSPTPSPQTHTSFPRRMQFWQSAFDQCIVGLVIFQLVMIGLLGELKPRG